MSSSHDFDVLVIGGGLTGAAAAWQAAQLGAHVAWAFCPGGATIHASGALNLADPPVPERSLLLEVGSWVDRNALAMLVLHRHHPYRLLPLLRPQDDTSEPGSLASFLFEGHAAFFSALEQAGWRWRGEGWRNGAALTSLGTAHPAARFPESVHVFDRGALEHERIAFLGIAGDPGFRADVAAANFDALRRGAGFSSPPSFCALLDIATVPPLSTILPERVRFALGDDGARRALLDAFARLCPDGVDRVLVPPIFDREDALIAPGDVDARFSQALAPGSGLEGPRLTRALRRCVENRGVSIFEAHMVPACDDGRSLSCVTLAVRSDADSPPAPTEVSAGAFILATGRMLGGGVVVDPRLREPIFDLPLFADDGPVGRRAAQELGLRDHGGQRALLDTVGLRCDDEGRPIDGFGRVCRENLYAAGSILAGYSPIFDGCAGGVALGTGLIAGERAARRVLGQRTSSPKDQRHGA